MNATKILDQVAQLPVPARCAFGLDVVRSLPEFLTGDPVGAEIALRGIKEADRWVAGEPVSPDLLESYFDGDGENGIGIREGRQTSKAQLHALVAITSAVGYVAWHAYDKAGRIDMSECTCEVGEHTLTDLVRFAVMSGAVDESALVRALVIARSLPQGA